MKKPLFILRGNGTHLNRGCEAILRSTVAIIRREIGPATFVNAPVVWVDDPLFREPDPDIVYTLPPYTRRWSREWIVYQFRKRLGLRIPAPYERYLPDARATLALGGDNFSLYYGRPYARFEANRITLDRGKPLVLWGASVGPFDTDPEFEKFAAEELKKVTLICARESETVAYLDSIGVRDNVRAVSDPAFALEPMSASLREPQAAMLEARCIGLNLSPLLEHFWDRPEPLEDVLVECVERVLAECDRPVLLIPHVVYPGSDDHAFMAQIVDRLKGDHRRVLLLDRGYNAQQLKWIIAQLEVFAGARTHATIAALSSNVPTLSISYSIKSTGINKDIFGHDGWVSALNDLSPESFVDKLKQLLGAAGEVRSQLERTMPAYKERAFLNGRYTKECTSGG